MLTYRRSTVEAYARFAPRDSKWTKHTVAEHVSIGGNGPVLIGTPAQVADGLEIWVEEADVDGFNFVSHDMFYSDPDVSTRIFLATNIVVGICLVSRLVQRYHRAFAARAQGPGVVLGRVH